MTHVNTSSFALKTNLDSLKTEINKINIPKLMTLPKDLADLTLKVQKDFTKKTDFSSLKTKVVKNESDNDNLESIINKNDTTTKSNINNLKTKVDQITLTKYDLKSTYDDKIGNIELKISDISGKLNTSDFNSKVNELKDKIKQLKINLILII